ncbi:hypothetical protein DFH08DRAFT_881689, partial [Mycena albidolilacea]
MPLFVAMIFTEPFQQSWGETGYSNPEVWGVQWITDHATFMKAANKPASLEDSTGITGDLIWHDLPDRSSVYFGAGAREGLEGQRM